MVSMLLAFAPSTIGSRQDHFNSPLFEYPQRRRMKFIIRDDVMHLIKITNFAEPSTAELRAVGQDGDYLCALDHLLVQTRFGEIGD